MPRAFFSSRRTAILLLVACLTVGGSLAQTKKSAKKSATAATTRHTAARGSSHTNRTVSAKDQSSGASARVHGRNVIVTRKIVRGRLVRTTQIVHTPPAPTFQTHPDQDRYVQIQQALAEKGYFRGEANGQWGDDSIDALKRFQTDRKLTNDGKISARSLIGLGLGPTRESAQFKGDSEQPVSQ